MFKSNDKKRRNVDLSKVDEQSVQVMQTFSDYCFSRNLTSRDVCASVIFSQTVKNKDRQKTVQLVELDNFVRTLKEVKVLGQSKELPRALVNYLKLRAGDTQFLKVDTIQMFIETLHDSSNFDPLSSLASEKIKV